MNLVRVVLVLMVLFFSEEASAQFYHKTFGNKTDPAIIFLHGGPGYNSFTFEASTASRLADEGYYVVVYDQRGCGRTPVAEGSKYTFEEAVSDLKNIYALTDIDHATLIGHSWGGALGLLFAEQYKGMVDGLVLVGAPMDYQQTFKAIISNARIAYKKQGKESQVRYLDMLETFDKESLQYANYCFLQAMSSGLYSAENPAPESKEIKEQIKESPDVKLASNMTQEPVLGLYHAEHYTTLKLYDRLNAVRKDVPVHAIYGAEDGLFDEEQLDAIKESVGADNFKLVQNASHSVFIDQQAEFLKLLATILK